jgi:hypothetical protein
VILAGVAMGIAVTLSGCFGDFDKNAVDLLSKDSVQKTGEKANAKLGKATPKADLLQELTVMNGALNIVAPQGYCIVKAATKDSVKGVYVPMGACAAVTKNRADPKPEKQAFLSVSVLAKDALSKEFSRTKQGAMKQAREFLESDAGKSALSSSGQADQVTIVEIVESENALFAYVKDGSSKRPQALENTTWRGFFVQNKMLVSASVTPFSDKDLSKAEGQKLLKNLVAAIQGANKGKLGKALGLDKLIGNLEN